LIWAKRKGKLRRGVNQVFNCALNAGLKEGRGGGCGGGGAGCGAEGECWRWKEVLTCGAGLAARGERKKGKEKGLTSGPQVAATIRKRKGGEGEGEDGPAAGGWMGRWAVRERKGGGPPVGVWD
jgi:hypothetical protein